MTRSISFSFLARLLHIFVSSSLNLYNNFQFASLALFFPVGSYTISFPPPFSFTITHLSFLFPKPQVYVCFFIDIFFCLFLFIPLFLFLSCCFLLTLSSSSSSPYTNPPPFISICFHPTFSIISYCINVKASSSFSTTPVRKWCGRASVTH